MKTINCTFHLLVRPAYFFFWQMHITQTREMNAPWVINAVDYSGRTAQKLKSARAQKCHSVLRDGS